jgi:hypothetical protein
LFREHTARINWKHGLANTLTYSSWYNMINRCRSTDPRVAKWHGSRGIKVCERWLHSFENFLADMGERPSLNHSIDRINNDLGYFPENCRWTTSKEQRRNQRQPLRVGRRACS